ncbi:hypothetical protein HUU42_02615 [bacterium]|nr:hypothetical protein [bacterium]
MMKNLGVKHLRINIMSNQSSKLKMIAHTDGFDNEEVKITLSMGQGCSGKAWNTKMEAITDLSKDVHWLSNEDQKRVKTGLSVILSLPLFDPDLPTIKKVIGTITFDSTEPIYEPLKKAIPTLVLYAEKISHLVKKSGL